MSSTHIISKAGDKIAEVNASNELQVIASLNAGTNNIGDVDVLTLPSIPAGTNNIGDVDVLTLPDGTKDFFQNQSPQNFTGDYSTQQTNTIIFTTPPLTKYYLTDIMVSVDTAMTVTLIDDTTTIRKYYLTANGGVVENLRMLYQQITANTSFKITTSAAGNCFISLQGYVI